MEFSWHLNKNNHWYMSTDLINRLHDFMEDEARSCSMDFGCVTPEYVFRMLGVQYPIEDIKEALSACLKECYER